MIFAAFILSQVTPAAGEIKTQQRVDGLVTECKAANIVTLHAESEKQVAMHMMKIAAPSKSENEKFDCVLAGMKAMPDLEFGFLGNAPSEPEAK